MQHKILISAPYMQPQIERFKAEITSHGLIPVIPKEINERLTEAELLEIIADISGVMCGDDRFTRKVIEKAKSLKVISKWGTGIDSIDQAACKDHGIQVFRTPDAFTEPVSDTVMAAILNFARNIQTQDELVKSGGWEKLPGHALFECTLGIIGIGRIGQAVAKKAAGFGMKILGYDIKKFKKNELPYYIQVSTIEEVLSSADYVSINCDMNPTSYRIINADRIKTMKAGSVLINTARGGLVDEEALIAAIESKRLQAAHLDVFEVEPLPLDAKIRKFKQITLGAHSSNASPTCHERIHKNTIANLLKGLGRA